MPTRTAPSHDPHTSRSLLMQKIHHFHDISALDCVMVKAYIFYQAVGSTNRTRSNRAGHIQRRRRWPHTDTPPHGECISASGARRTRRDGTRSSKRGWPRSIPLDSLPSAPSGMPDVNLSALSVRTPRSTWCRRRTWMPLLGPCATSACRREAHHASCRAVPRPHGLCLHESSYPLPPLICTM
jgi:hypothetical protein